MAVPLVCAGWLLSAMAVPPWLKVVRPRKPPNGALLVQSRKATLDCQNPSIGSATAAAWA